jgi:hypothetical protein
VNVVPFPTPPIQEIQIKRIHPENPTRFAHPATVRREKDQTKLPNRHASLVLPPAKPSLLLLALLINRGRSRSLRSPSLLRSRLLPLLDIPPRRTATALAQRNQESQDRSRSRDPHERKHLRADASLNIELFDGGDGILHDDEEDCGDDGGDGGEEGGEEGEDGNEQADPAGVDCEELDGDHDEGEAGTGEEEGEHPVGHESDEVEDFGHVGGEGDWEGSRVSGWRVKVGWEVGGTYYLRPRGAGFG